MIHVWKLPLVAAALGAAGLLSLAVPAGAAPQDEEPSEEGAAGEVDEDEDEADSEDDRWIAVVGGEVHTGTGAVLRGATVLARNGKIREIGYGVYVPPEAEVVDAKGMRVYPGLVALGASSRLTKGTLAPELEDLDPHGGLDERTSMHVGHEEDDGHGEEVEEAAEGLVEGSRPGRAAVEDEYDPFSSYLVLALSAGITCAEQSNTAIKLKRGEIDGVAMKEKHMNTFPWTSGARASLREKFSRAAEYLRKYRIWEEKKKKDKDLKEPSRKGVDSSALAVLKGEQLAKFKVHERDDLLAVARLAQEFGFRPVIEGAREGWTVADELGRAGAFAIVTPRDRADKDEKLVRPGGSTIENAAILHRSGVQVAVVPRNTGIELSGMTGRDLLHLPIEAAFAVRGGLSDTAALQSLTIVPARLLGVAHRVGTIEVGKDMDVIVTDGDVLHYETFVQKALVAGKVVYDKDEELLFSHIRPRAVAPLPEGEDADEEEAAEEPDPAEEPAAEEEPAPEPDEEPDDEEEDEEEEDEEEEDEEEEDEEETPEDGTGR